MKKKLLFFLLLFYSFCYSQNYTVSSIPFQIYEVGDVLPNITDDHCSPSINLMFPFIFYGETYNYIVISNNGYIDFNQNNANEFSPWQINSTIPSTSFPIKNSILGCYHDLYNNNNTIFYTTIGYAPYRKFVVSYIDNFHFINLCDTPKSSFQIVLHESFNIIDVQLINKQSCNEWNNGSAICGLINIDGGQAITPPNRNTGNWTAFEEGWRFTPKSNNESIYRFVKCDSDLNGFEIFNLQVVQQFFNNENPSNVIFYENISDAQNGINQINDLNYINNSNPQILYIEYGSIISTISLEILNCNLDFDLDTVQTTEEDLNGDSNLNNDDSDNDGIPNYLDDDDDNDNTLTINEDYNNNSDPTDDDTNNNGIFDYLDTTVSLNFHDEIQSLTIFPIPFQNTLNIKLENIVNFINITIYDLNGKLVYNNKFKNPESQIQIQLDYLSSGVYSVYFENENVTKKAKIIKK
jgi:hypothetical protein